MYFTIYQGMLFPIRGMANREFLEQVLQQIPDGEPFYIVEFAHYPDELSYVLEGESHQQLLEAFARVWGHPIALGDLPPWEDGLPRAAVDVEADSLHPHDPQKTNMYQPYDANPDRYQWIIDLWQE